ncbi:chorismate synthase [bacterium]|jgi:chorismate synthase|nr:chorismate synthase [bacterium]MBT3795875.1 chorismate synthase [bacterium]MBT4634327.1 chorismate synthase [bacterium]
MSGNSFGNIFKITTWGESHGKALGVVVDGCPAGLKISNKDIQLELDRRKPGQSKYTTQRKESDKVEILSGIFNGTTTGTPISMLIPNADAISKSYENFKDIYRPGHADLSYDEKYGIRDYRGGGRSSNRETVGRVAAGAIAKKILKTMKIKTFGFVSQIGNLKCEKIDVNYIEKNPLRIPDKSKLKDMGDLIDKVRKQGDSIGGIIEVRSLGVPAGLGSPVFEKFDARLASAIMGIGGVRGFEIGLGFSIGSMRGSEVNDIMVGKSKGKVKFNSNNAGGILGGITNGNDVVLRFALKPTSSISQIQKSINSKGKVKNLQVKGRHDPCLCPRAVPIAEAMVNLVLLDCILENKLTTLKKII